MDDTMNEEQMVEDLESALKEMAKNISAEYFLMATRNTLESGRNATYILNIKKCGNGIFCGLDVDEREPRRRVLHFCKLK
jgi:hypothetical protein